MTNKPLKIPGDYQYRVLTKGHPIQRFWHTSRLALLGIIGDFSSKDIVLDAGCGSGNVSFYLAKIVKKVIGLDIKEDAINFAANHARRLKLKKAVFRVADLRKIPYAKNYFTKVILFEVIEYLDQSDYEKMLCEIRRAMKPGGLLYITTPNKLSSWPFIRWVLDTFRLVPPLQSNQHILSFTPFRLKRALSKSGFVLKDIGSMNHISPFVSPISWKLAKKIFEFEVKYLKSLGPIIWTVAKK